ncbi:MAG: lipid-A-disaccharide synthase N-terminal domain-containing protein [Desulfobacterales bacterium]
MSANTIWIAIGLAGQALFSARFLVQWIYSERRKQSIIPTAFWYLSIGGSLTLLTYAIYRKDPVFIIGQASGFAIYLRNLQFIYRENKRRQSEKS